MKRRTLLKITAGALMAGAFPRVPFRYKPPLLVIRTTNRIVGHYTDEQMQRLIEMTKSPDKLWRTPIIIEDDQRADARDVSADLLRGES